jgi:hypothetical protein
VGLNPILVFTEGHAFAGCRLSEDTFPDSIIYDCSAITKRTAVGIDEICLVECTDFVVGKSVDFDTASAHANAALSDAEKFEHAVDIARSRGCGIRPIPTRVQENGVYKIADYSERKKSDITAAPSEIDLSVHAITAPDNRNITKQDIWERKLLDLSLRNSLLNFRPRSSNIQLMSTDLAQLEDEISSGNDFKIMPAPNDFNISASENKMYEVEDEKELISTGMYQQLLACIFGVILGNIGLLTFLFVDPDLIIAHPVVLGLFVGVLRFCVGYSNIQNRNSIQIMFGCSHFQDAAHNDFGFIHDTFGVAFFG